MNPGTIAATKNINGQEIVFRYPTLSDAVALMEYINTLSTERTFIRFQGEQISLEEEEQYLKSLLKAMKEKNGGAILAWHENTLVGMIGLRPQEKIEKHVLDFGLSVKKEYRDQGIGKALIQVMLDQVRLHLTHISIVTLSVQADNLRAVHLYQKLGFIEYGRLPKGICRNNEFEDKILMYLRLFHE